MSDEPANPVWGEHSAEPFGLCLRQVDWTGSATGAGPFPAGLTEIAPKV